MVNKCFKTLGLIINYFRICSNIVHFNIYILSIVLTWKTIQVFYNVLYMRAQTTFHSPLPYAHKCGALWIFVGFFLQDKFNFNIWFLSPLQDLTFQGPVLWNINSLVCSRLKSASKLTENENSFIIPLVMHAQYVEFVK